MKSQEMSNISDLVEISGNKRPTFGNRHLTEDKNVFEHNAWDNVVWDEEQEEAAKKKTTEQLKTPLETTKQEELEENADRYWDQFYMEHQNRFFKDRHWLFTEFPELAPSDITEHLTNSSQHVEGEDLNTLSADTSYQYAEKSLDGENVHVPEGGGCMLRKAGKTLEMKVDGKELEQLELFPGEHSAVRIWEVGCGVGNTVFPVLQTNNDPALMVYCCDFSSTAIGLVKEHPDYNPRRCTAFVCDISDESCSVPFPENTVDVVILIFVLSAIHPDKMQYVVNRLASYLKPGGKLLFRDYGRYDMAQLRFKKGRCLSENFYVRGDGTRVYFFTQEEVRDLCTRAGLIETQNLVDRRLQVNRGRQLKMYRVWIQCKYTKPTEARGDTAEVLHPESMNSPTPSCPERANFDGACKHQDDPCSDQTVSETDSGVHKQHDRHGS